MTSGDEVRAVTVFEVALDDDESLGLFLEAMREFDQQFCDLLTAGNDFTIRLEVHGNAGRLLHARTYRDHIRRPAAAGANRKARKAS